MKCCTNRITAHCVGTAGFTSRQIRFYIDFLLSVASKPLNCSHFSLKEAERQMYYCSKKKNIFIYQTDNRTNGLTHILLTYACIHHRWSLYLNVQHLREHEVFRKGVFSSWVYSHLKFCSVSRLNLLTISCFSSTNFCERKSLMSCDSCFVDWLKWFHWFFSSLLLSEIYACNLGKPHDPMAF